MRFFFKLCIGGIYVSELSISTIFDYHEPYELKEVRTTCIAAQNEALTKLVILVTSKTTELNIKLSLVLWMKCQIQPCDLDRMSNSHRESSNRGRWNSISASNSLEMKTLRIADCKWENFRAQREKENCFCFQQTKQNLSSRKSGKNIF